MVIELVKELRGVKSITTMSSMRNDSGQHVLSVVFGRGTTRQMIRDVARKKDFALHEVNAESEGQRVDQYWYLRKRKYAPGEAPFSIVLDNMNPGEVQHRPTFHVVFRKHSEKLTRMEKMEMIELFKELHYANTT